MTGLVHDSRLFTVPFSPDSEVSLKILAHNNLIGRIIGKGGSTIKRVMQETDTKITVSRYAVTERSLNHFNDRPTIEMLHSLSDVSSYNMERVITIKGSIENMSKAEAMISGKLRQSYESDLQAMAVSRGSFSSFPHRQSNLIAISLRHSRRT